MYSKSNMIPMQFDMDKFDSDFEKIFKEKQINNPPDSYSDRYTDHYSELDDSKEKESENV